MSRMFSGHCVTFHAYRVQTRAFVSGLLWSVAFIGFALTNRENAAMACALLACFCYGVAAGAWIAVRRFRD